MLGRRVAAGRQHNDHNRGRDEQRDQRRDLYPARYAAIGMPLVLLGFAVHRRSRLAWFAVDGRERATPPETPATMTFGVPNAWTPIIRWGDV